MKKIITFFAVIAIFLSISATPVFSAPDIGFGEGGMTKNIGTKAGYETSQDQYALSRTVGGIIRGVLSLIGVIFLVLTVYAGVLWMTASGSEDKITKAKDILKSSVIGLVIVTAAYGITALVFNFIIGASSPSTDVGGYSPGQQMGCCVNASESKCLQTATRAACSTKYGDGYTYYDGESCTPYISQNTGCSIEFE